MKKLTLDLREIDYPEIPETWADAPQRVELENAILDYIGKVVVVKITEKREVSHGSQGRKNLY